MDDRNFSRESGQKRKEKERKFLSFELIRLVTESAEKSRQIRFIKEKKKERKKEIGENSPATAIGRHSTVVTGGSSSAFQDLRAATTRCA